MTDFSAGALKWVNLYGAVEFESAEGFIWVGVNSLICVVLFPVTLVQSVSSRCTSCASSVTLSCERRSFYQAKTVLHWRTLKSVHEQETWCVSFNLCAHLSRWGSRQVKLLHVLFSVWCLWVWSSRVVECVV